VPDVVTAYNIPPDVIGQARTIIRVDDGLATGSSRRAAVNAVRQERPRATARRNSGELGAHQ